MRSRISVEVDFDNNNRPVIQVHERDSDDVRDRLISAVFDKLGHHSRWFRVEFKHNTMTDGDAGSLWHLAPISPEEYDEEIKLMVAHRGSQQPTGPVKKPSHIFPSQFGITEDNEVEYTISDDSPKRWGKVVAVKFTAAKVYYDIIDDTTAEVTKEIPSHFVNRIAQGNS